jgi:hypothetical protein
MAKSHPPGAARRAALAAGYEVQVATPDGPDAERI